jgi:hypothetical protein
MIVTTNEIKNNAIFLLPENDTAKIEISHKYKNEYYFIRYFDIDNYHYSTYCSPSINDIAREINTNLTTLKP